MERNKNPILANDNVHIMGSRDILNIFLLARIDKEKFHNKFTCTKNRMLMSGLNLIIEYR